MCRHEHELCQCDLRGLSKEEVNEHYFEFIRNATKEEYEANGWGFKATRGLYKCRICGEKEFIRKQHFKNYLQICKNYCNGSDSERVVTGYNDLATKLPHLAKQWCYCKNDDLTPYEIGVNSNKKIFWICDKHSEHIYDAVVYSRKDGNGCPYCSNHRLLRGFNDVATTRNDLLIFFDNKNDGYKYMANNRTDLIDLKCPDCGKPKKMFLNDLTQKGFSCPFCSYGNSFPEKVLALLLDFLNIKFKKQLKFDECNFLYDFYLTDYDIIIEVHGKQHYNLYRQSNWKSYKDEHENDMIKYDIAVLKGFEYNKNYFIIDARQSNIEWLRNSINNCLFFQQFDLNNIDWKEFDRQAQKSKKVEVCRYWEEQKAINKDLTPIIMVEIFKVSHTTICEWLNWGNKNGLCVYNGEKERATKIRRESKFVYLIKPNGTKWYDEAMSLHKLSRLTGVSRDAIKRSISGKPLGGKGATTAKYDSKYIGSYVVEADKLEEFLLNLKGGDIIE